MSRSYTSPERLKYLTLGVSLSGMLCLGLAGLLPWSVFIVVAGIYAAIGKWFYAKEVISQKTAIGAVACVVFIELFLLAYAQDRTVLILIRDLIVLLAFIRLLMSITHREIYQIIGIAVSQCLLATIFTISPLFLVGVVVMVVLIPMILSELDAAGFGAGEYENRDRKLHWFYVSSGIILTACILFYLLPRPASSIIRHSLVQRNKVVFAEDVNLKKNAPDRTDNAILMRVIWSYGKAPDRFYLSGTRLERLDPDGFFKDESQGSVLLNEGMYSDILRIYPALLDSRYVYFPYWMKGIMPGTYQIKGSNIYWSGDQPYVYEVRVSRLPGSGKPCGTELPEELREVGKLGRQIAGDADIATRIRRIAGYLQSSYSYTLSMLEIPAGNSAIHWFVFKGKKGGCEHFASSLAAMIRGCGIPARVVTGFLVTEFNESGSYFIVRTSDAHAWVEYWDGSWKTVDATPYGRRSGGLRFHVIDELRFRWQRWVIQYSLDDQIRIAVGVLSLKPRINREIENISSYFIYLIVCAFSVWFCINIYLSRSRSPYEKVRKALFRKGIRLPENRTHEEHLALVHEKWELFEPEFREYLNGYLAWRFRKDSLDIESLTRDIIKKRKAVPLSHNKQ